MSSTFNSVNEIVEAVVLGDRKGKRLLYLLLKEKCFPNVRSYIGKRGGNIADAEDKFQDAMIVLMDAIQKEKFRIRQLSTKSPVGQLCSYVMQVVKNLWKKELQWRNRPPLPVERHETIHFDLFSGVVAEKFESLEEECRSLLVLYFQQKKSPRTIGRELGWVTEKVKKQLSGCMTHLLKDIGQLMQNGFSEDLDQLVRESVASLEEHCQKLLSQFYYSKKSMTEIAQEMGYASARSATEQKHKCMKHVNKAVVKHLLKL